MDKFNRIINETGLYDFRVIKEMGERHHKWHCMSWRERELLLLHIHLCILMCNKEVVGGRKRRYVPSSKKEEYPVQHKVRKIDTDAGEGTSRQEHDKPDKQSVSSSSGSYESSWSNDEEILLELKTLELDKNYRFRMLNYMPLPEITINHIATDWNISVPTTKWDIVDKVRKLFIMIRYTSKKERALNQYYSSKIEVPNNCCLYLIKWGETKGEWVDVANMRAQGEEKVERFLLKRKMTLESVGINTEFFKMEVDSVKELFPSPWVNDCLDRWKEDLLEDQFESWSLAEKYKKEAAPKMITAKALLNHLDHLNENAVRSSKMYYKGKILPEGMVKNMFVEEREDSSCVDRILSCIKDQLSNLEEVIEKNMSEKSTLHASMLPDVIKAWECSHKSTFNFVNPMNYPSHKQLEAALGIGAKKKTYSEYRPDMKQPPGEDIKKCIYPDWYEEVLCGLAEKHVMYLSHIPMGDLIKTPPTDNHPIAEVVENSVSDMVEIILQSKAALMTSKLTNLYSRLGGAYNSGVTETNKDRRNIAIFPLVSQMSSNDSQGDIGVERLRLCSGVVIRAPSHARKPTDRIGLVTIEMLEKNEVTMMFCGELKGAIVYVCKQMIVVVRQNSVMKEDSAYNTFVANSMFIPLNMLGGMTLENPDISQSENMVAYISDITSRGQDWFLNRYIEGLCFALLGNSRDEGYFAHLRKIFMVVFTWRIGKSSASFDISKFCEKTNECLVDNPVSMHFHKTLIEILKIYDARREREREAVAHA